MSYTDTQIAKQIASLLKSKQTPIFQKGTTSSTGINKEITVRMSNGKVVRALGWNVSTPGEVTVFWDAQNKLYVAWKEETNSLKRKTILANRKTRPDEKKYLWEYFIKVLQPNSIEGFENDSSFIVGDYSRISMTNIGNDYIVTFYDNDTDSYFVTYGTLTRQFETEIIEGEEVFPVHCGSGNFAYYYGGFVNTAVNPNTLTHTTTFGEFSGGTFIENVLLPYQTFADLGISVLSGYTKPMFFNVFDETSGTNIYPTTAITTATGGGTLSGETIYEFFENADNEVMTLIKSGYQSNSYTETFTGYEKVSYYDGTIETETNSQNLTSSENFSFTVENYVDFDGTSDFRDEVTFDNEYGVIKNIISFTSIRDLDIAGSNYTSPFSSTSIPVNNTLVSSIDQTDTITLYKQITPNTPFFCDKIVGIFNINHDSNNTVYNSRVFLTTLNYNKIYQCGINRLYNFNIKENLSLHKNYTATFSAINGFTFDHDALTVEFYERTNVNISVQYEEQPEPYPYKIRTEESLPKNGLSDYEIVIGNNGYIIGNISNGIEATGFVLHGTLQTPEEGLTLSINVFDAYKLDEHDLTARHKTKTSTFLVTPNSIEVTTPVQNIVDYHLFDPIPVDAEVDIYIVNGNVSQKYIGTISSISRNEQTQNDGNTKSMIYEFVTLSVDDTEPETSYFAAPYTNMVLIVSKDNYNTHIIQSLNLQNVNLYTIDNNTIELAIAEIPTTTTPTTLRADIYRFNTSTLKWERRPNAMTPVSPLTSTSDFVSYHPTPSNSRKKRNRPPRS